MHLSSNQFPPADPRTVLYSPPLVLWPELWVVEFHAHYA